MKDLYKCHHTRKHIATCRAECIHRGWHTIKDHLKGNHCGCCVTRSQRKDEAIKNRIEEKGW